MQSRQGVPHFRVKGKRGKVRFVPVHAMAQRLIEEYLALVGHGADTAGLVFRPVTNNRTGDLDRPLDPASVYQNIVRKIWAGDRYQRRGERAVRPFAARYCRD
jgi:integrase/recombinase XerD